MSQTTEDFDVLVARHRGELFAHCYRMLGSPYDAEDALQDALVGAWKGYAGFEGRSSARTWLYRIATNACLKQIERRPRRILTPDFGPAYMQTVDLGELLFDQDWLEPLPGDAEQMDDPESAYLRREGVELAYVAALQHLPGAQRAVLIMREVLRFSAEEVAAILDTTVDSVTSALARARRTMADRGPEISQQQELGALGEEGVRDLVDRFMAAWEAADVRALTDLLAVDARFTMPPLPCWYDGRDSVLMFLTERAFATSWRFVVITANAQPGLAFYQAGDDGVFRLGGVNLLGLRDGRVQHIAAFLDPASYAGFELPETL
jgi:RNA polymerase sigma-70 factor (TIGR02960 family)